MKLRRPFSKTFVQNFDKQRVCSTQHSFIYNIKKKSAIRHRTYAMAKYHNRNCKEIVIPNDKESLEDIRIEECYACILLHMTPPTRYLRRVNEDRSRRNFLRNERVCLSHYWILTSESRDEGRGFQQSAIRPLLYFRRMQNDILVSKTV